jgi:hypothetical protein
MWFRRVTCDGYELVGQMYANPSFAYDFLSFLHMFVMLNAVCLCYI